MKSVIITVVLLLFAFSPVYAANTTVAQTVVGPNNVNASGTATIRITVACNNGSNFVGQRDIVVNFTNGAFSQSLVPTDACVITGSATGVAWSSVTTYAIADRATYAGAVFAAVAASTNVVPGSNKLIWQQISPTYKVHFKLITGVEWDEDWAVPTSGSPVTIATVRVGQPSLPTFISAGPPGAAGPAGPTGPQGPAGASGGSGSITFEIPLIRTVDDVTIQVATNTQGGYLSSVDWSIFNGKQNALGFTPVPNTRLVAGHALSSDVTLVKGDVGLGNVDNTSDANKPVSTAQQTALDGKLGLHAKADTAGAADTAVALATLPTACPSGQFPLGVNTGGNAVNCTTIVSALGFTPVPNTRLVAGHALSGDVTLVKGDVGLGNVDNTSDANKPISTATQTALDLKQNLLTNPVTAPVGMTTTAIVTAAGAATVQTPSATATMDSSGNISTPGNITVGSGSSAAGGADFKQGTAGVASASSVGFQAPASVTSAFRFTLPGGPAAGFWRGTNTTPSVVSLVELSGDCTTSGSGVITCVQINGTSIPASPTADQVLVITATSVGVWKSLANCVAAGGVIQYATATHAYSCHTLVGSDMPGTVMQTNQANTITAGRQDASGAASTAPMKTGTNSAKPATCVTGDLYFATDLTAGQQILECSSTNTWTQQLNSGSGGTGCTPGGSSGDLQTNNGSGGCGAAHVNDNGTTVKVTEELDVVANPITIEVANEAGTGTTVNKIAKVTGAPMTATIATTADTSGEAIGIVVGGAGTTSNARIAREGIASCVFDAATTADDYVTVSSTVNGDCHDFGSTPPKDGSTIIGRVQSTNGAGGTFAVLLRPPTNGNMPNPMTGVGESIYGGANGLPTRLAAGTGFYYLNNTSPPTIGKLARGLSFSLGDPGGSALTVGGANSVDYITVPFGCTVSAYNLVIDAADSTFRVKWWKVATGTAIPTSGNSISTSGLGVSTGTAIHSTTVSDFTTTTVTANDIIAMALATANTVKYIGGVLQCDQ